MKRKFVAAFLAITLSISMSVTTFAAELPQNVVEQEPSVMEESTAEEADATADETKEEEDVTAEEVPVTEKSQEVESEEEKSVESVASVEEKSAKTDVWTAEDFTYEEMSERLYGCDYSREFTVSGLAVSGFSESGEEKLKTNKDLVIPEKSPDGTTIMGVTDEAFKEKGLTSVKFPEGCMVPYDDTVTHVVTERGNFLIGQSAFYKNNLTEVNLPEGVIAVLTSAFHGNQLEHVTLPSTIWWLENSSFANNSISELNFPKTCTFQCEIHAFAFAKNRIKSVRLPDYTMVVEKKAFLYNPGVESVPANAPSGEAEMGGVVYMYTDNPNLVNMERIHHIDQKSEAQLSWHQKLIVGGKPEVDNTWTIKDFTFQGTAVTGLSESGLAKSQNDKELVLPEKTSDGKAVTAVKGSFQAKGTPFTYVEIPGTVTEIGAHAFAGCKISKLSLPQNLKKLGEGAFLGNEIATLSVPGTVEVIPVSAFAQEKAILKELSLGEGIREIQAEAFANSRLTTVNLPDSLKTLDKDTFKRDASEKIVLYTNVENSYPESEYHKVKRNLGDWNEEDFTYEGTVVTGFSETGKLKSEDNHNLVIPEKNPDGDYITEIGTTIPQDTDGLFGGEGVWFDTVKLPSKVEKIGMGAFRGLKLQKVTFPETLKEIGSMAFHTNELKEIILPDSVTVMGDAAFATNMKVEKIVLSKSLTKIPRTAFGNTTACAPYTELVIPEGVTEIGNNAFNGNSLKKIEIPGSVTKIGSSAFMNTDVNRTLTEITLHEGVTNVGNKAFAYANLTKAELPTTVTTLHKNAFYGNADGKVAVYVDSMEQYDTLIKTASDWHIIKIKPGEWTTDDFTYEGTVVTGFSEKGLLKREDKAELAIPDKTPSGEWVTEIGATTNANGLFGMEGHSYETLTLPAKLEKIGNNAFKASGIQNVSFPETLKEIGNLAFQTNELTEIMLPDCVTKIGSAAFSLNPKTEKIVLSKGMTEIPASAFMNNDSALYTELTIPNTIESIGSRAFAGNKIKKLEIPGSVKEIGSYAFNNPEGKETLEELILNEGLEKIGSTAFGAARLKSVDLPTTVNKKKALNASTFKNNVGGTVIAWANSQEQIDVLSDGLKNPTFELRNKDMFTYEVKEGEASITGLSEGAVVGEVLLLPRTTPDGTVITEIADAKPAQGTAPGGTFNQGENTKYTEVVLPTELKKIGKFAFQRNGIEKVEFPEGLKEIGQAAFNSNNLTSIILPDSVTTLGANVFAGNNDVSEVVLSKNLKEIPSRAFQTINGTEGAANFTEIEIPDGVEVIGSYAFADNHFKNLVIPDSVKEIGSSAFFQTTEGMVLESVTLSKNLESIGSKAFGNSNLSYVTIPSTLKELKKNAFAGAKKGIVYLYASDKKQLEETSKFKPKGDAHEVVLEEMLNSGWTFEDFTYEGTTVTGWSEQGNLTRKQNQNLVIPTVNPFTKEAITAIGDSAFCIPEDEWDQGHTGVESVNGMETVQIPATVTKIGDNAFQYNNLETVAFPEGLQSIGGNAFNSNKMKAVSIPDSVTEMKTGAFSSNDITEIKLSEGLTKLEEGVFSNNIHLTHVDIPNTITEIEDFAFSGDRIASLEIPKSVTKIGRAAFKLHRMTEITIPGTVKEIGDSAFEGTYKGITMKKLTLEEGIETIGSLAFRMGYLEEVKIPNSVKSMAADVFKDNTGYKASNTVRCYTSNPVHMEFEMDRCQEFVFRADWTEDCFTYAGTTITGFSEKGLSYLKYTKEVVLPDQNPEGEWITAISAGAFKGYGLTKVTFPSHLEEIGEEAFLENALTEVKLPTTIKDVAENAFDPNVKVEIQKEEPDKPDGNDDPDEGGEGAGTPGGSGSEGNGSDPAGKDSAKNENNSVKTADTAPILPFGMTAVISLAIITAILTQRKISDK